MRDWIIFLPELFAMLAAGWFFLACFAKPNARRDYSTALVFCAFGIAVSLAAVNMHGILFSGTYQINLFSQVFKILIAAGFFLAVCLCKDLGGVDEKYHSEFYLLMAICTLAMMMLVSCVHLLTLYISLEVSSFSLYILTYLQKHGDKQFQTGLKYFIIGATSSAIMLFGFALLYGAGHSGYLAVLSRTLPANLSSPVVLIAFFLSFAGFFFKLSLFPFHFWAPDVYENAPHQVSTYLATVSKIAAIAVLIRLAALCSGQGEKVAYFLIVLSLLSMTVGNLSAVGQNDFKRLLAFSSVAHAGYVLIGILSLSALGFSSAIFYAISLLMMKFVAFMVVVYASVGGKNIDIAQLAGLHRRSPMLSLALMLSMFGLAGIPPTIGFTSKLLIFTAAINKG